MAGYDLKVAVWELTLACDSRCLHCGSDAKVCRKNELSTSESLDLVRQLADLGCERIYLSGGEPTLRKDWAQVCEEIRTRGMEFGIISNALAWNDKTIDTLVGLGPYSVAFSVDGEPETHDYCRGYKGSHEKIFDTISKMVRAQQPVCVITAVNKRNQHELPAIRKRLFVYDVPFWQLQIASPMGRMAQHRDLVLNEHEYYKFGQFVDDSRRTMPRTSVQAADCTGYFGSLKVQDAKWEGCHAGLCGVGIESDGAVKGCLSIRAPQAIEGYLRDRPLADIWNDQTKFGYNRAFEVSRLEGGCAGCPKGAICKGGCRSQSFSFTKSFYSAPYCFLRYEQSNAQTAKKREKRQRNAD